MPNSDRSFKNVWPSEDRLLLRPVEVPEITPGGIVLPESARTKSDRRSSGQGIVLAKGPGRLINGDYVPTACNVGDTVSFGEFAGSDIVVDGEKLLVMNWVEVLCILPVGEPAAVKQEPEVLTEASS